MMATHPTTAPSDSRSASDASAALSRIRGRMRRLVVMSAAAGVLALGLAVALGAGLVDFALHLPRAVRVVLWTAGLAGLGYLVVVRVLPAVRFRPSLSDVALRVERLPGAKEAGLAGLLASGVEFEQQLGVGDAERRDEVRRLVGQRFGPSVAKDLLSRRPLGVAGGLLAGAMVLIALVWVVSPTLARIGTARVLAPWSDVSWPKRTGVMDATSAPEVHPLGVAIQLRAALTRTNRSEGETPVAAYVRYVRDGEAGEAKRLLLTGQRSVEEMEVDGQWVRAELYERPLELPEMLADAGGVLELEYWFETSDDQTRARRVRLERSPAVRAATLTIEPPGYAAGLLGAGDVLVRGERSLGDGLDERAVVGPVLAGSSYSLAVEFNKDVARGVDSVTRWMADFDAASTEFRGGGGAIDGLAMSGVIERSARIELPLTDEYGLSSVDVAGFAIEVVEDRPASLTVVDPAQDEAVLATAVVPVEGEARDDLALDEVWLERVVAHADRGSEGAALVRESPAEEIARRDVRELPVGARRTARVAGEVDLSALSLSAGDEVWLSVLAQDAYRRGEDRHEVARSTVRRLLIIDATTLAERLRAELEGIRDAAVRLDELQAEVERTTARVGHTDATARQQRAIGEQVASQRQVAERIGARLERNRLEDATLEGMIRDAALSLEAAQEASGRATSAIDGLEEGPEDPDLRREAAEAQREVRDELGRLAEMLGQGKEDWLVRRDVERLLQEQRELAEQTSALGQQTVGRSVSDLSAQELSELDRIAQRQREAADRMSEALDALSERGRQLREADPSQSAAMRQAAERGRQAQAERSMREAGEQVQQNQTGQAGQNQQQAIDALEEMLEDLDSAEGQRDAALRRVLASLIESLESLIRQQERELAALGGAHGALAGLDQAMIRVHANTLQVMDVARAEGRELASVVDLIDEAVAAQEGAIGALRAGEGDRAAIDETTSLDRLKAARDEARRLEDEAAERDNARQRQELLGAYREALEQQVGLRGETAPMVGLALSRRDRQTVRSLGERQEALQQMLADVRARTVELADVGMVDYAHRRLDSAMDRASGVLRGGEATPGVARDQDTAVRILQAMVESMREAQQQERDAFEQGQAGGAGGQGGGSGQEQPLVPPIAELKLLREMQAEAMEWTRAIEEGQAEATQRDEVSVLQRELERQGMELIQKMTQQQGGPGAGVGPGGQP